MNCSRGNSSWYRLRSRCARRNLVRSAIRVATIGAMRVGLNELSDRETVRHLAGRDRQVPAHESASLRLKYRAGSSGKTFGTFTDLLQHAFKLSQFFWRDVLERAFDKRRMPAEEREEHLLPFLSQSYCSHPAIVSALYAADETFLV